MKNESKRSKHKKRRINPPNEVALIEHNETITPPRSTRYLTQVMNNPDLMIAAMSWLSDTETPESLFKILTDKNHTGKIILKGQLLPLILTFHWLYERLPKAQITSRVSDFVSSLSQVKWLINTTLYNFPGTSLINKAASRGSLDVIKWAREQKTPYPWNERNCTNAAGNGHLEVLQWLRAQDPPCPWDKWTCAAAASNGHLEVLQWLRAQNPPCPWGEMTCYEAASNGHLEVLQWLRAQNPPCPWHEEDYYRIARLLNHSHIMEWMRPTASSSSSNTITQNARQSFFNAASTARIPETNRSDSSMTPR